jgi:hypothetical protein
MGLDILILVKMKLVSVMKGTPNKRVTLFQRTPKRVARVARAAKVNIDLLHVLLNDLPPLFLNHLSRVLHNGFQFPLQSHPPGMVAMAAMEVLPHVTLLYKFSSYNFLQSHPLYSFTLWIPMYKM